MSVACPLLLVLLDSASLKTAVCVCRYLLLLNWLLLHTARMCINVSVITVVGRNELSLLEGSALYGRFEQKILAPLKYHSVSPGISG